MLKILKRVGQKTSLMKTSSMKWYIVISAITILIFNSCKCKDKKYADLVLNSMQTIFAEQTANSKIFHIGCDVTNQIYETVCKCEKLNEAGENTFEGNIYYSPDSFPPANWGSPTTSGSFRQPPLTGCAKDKRTIDAEFLQDGIYKVESIIDFLHEITEEYENNNSQ